MVEKFKFLLSKALRRLRPAALRRCRIDPNARVLGGSDLSDVQMGRYSYCVYGCQITNCEIGAFCSIAGNVVIGGSAHPVDAVSTSPVFHDGVNILGCNFANHPFQPNKRTVIGNDVWIGYAAIIKAGITIGDGAVIGTGSVVTKDVPPYAIWAGVPAREIRKRFDEATCHALLELRWWDWSKERLDEWGEAFRTPEILLKRMETK